MEVVRKTCVEEIESHLLRLGGKNQQDNMQSIRHFPFFYVLRLSQNEFHGLVFLQCSGLHAIVPLDQDRRLQAVAERAAILGRVRLSDNWDLGEIRDRFDELRTEREAPILPSLLLRDARANEMHHGPWYLQDGSHRTLGYAIAILEQKVTYVPQLAYLATHRENPL